MLDNDVDVAVCAMLRAAGHDCWSVADVIPTDSQDDDVAVAADTRQAVVITHDKGFAARRRRATDGQLIHLRCENPDAVAVLEHWLADILPALAHKEHIVVDVHPDKYTVHGPRWDPPHPD